MQEGKNIIEFSIIVPVYYAEGTIRELYQQITNFFKDYKKTYEVIFVEDGGKDKSWLIIEQLKNEYPRTITGIKLSKNYGQHNAILCGLSFAKGDKIITMDDDLQHLPTEIEKMDVCYQNEDADLVYGYYKREKHSLFKTFGSFLIRKTSRLRTKSNGNGSSFRLISKELAKKIVQHDVNFIFIDEVLLWYTDNVSFVKVEPGKNAKKKSRYSSISLLRVTFNIMFFYTAFPLKIMTYGGLITSVISFLLGVRFIFKKVMYNAPLGYTSVIVSIFFATSLILLCLGIIGGYMFRLYKMQNKKPPFSIKKVL